MDKPTTTRMAALSRNSSMVPSWYHHETAAGGSIIRLAVAIRNPTTLCTDLRRTATYPCSDKGGADLEQVFDGRNLRLVRHEQKHMVVFPDDRVVMRDDDVLVPDHGTDGGAGG